MPVTEKLPMEILLVKTTEEFPRGFRWYRERREVKYMAEGVDREGEEWASEEWHPTLAEAICDVLNQVID